MAAHDDLHGGAESGQIVCLAFACLQIARANHETYLTSCQILGNERVPTTGRRCGMAVRLISRTPHHYRRDSVPSGTKARAKTSFSGGAGEMSSLFTEMIVEKCAT